MNATPTHDNNMLLLAMVAIIATWGIGIALPFIACWVYNIFKVALRKKEDETVEKFDLMAHLSKPENAEWTGVIVMWPLAVPLCIVYNAIKFIVAWSILITFDFVVNLFSNVNIANILSSKLRKALIALKIVKVYKEAEVSSYRHTPKRVLVTKLAAGGKSVTYYRDIQSDEEESMVKVIRNTRNTLPVD